MSEREEFLYPLNRYHGKPELEKGRSMQTYRNLLSKSPTLVISKLAGNSLRKRVMNKLKLFGNSSHIQRSA